MLLLMLLLLLCVAGKCVLFSDAVADDRRAMFEAGVQALKVNIDQLMDGLVVYLTGWVSYFNSEKLHC